MSTTIKSIILSFILAIVAAILYRFATNLNRVDDNKLEDLPAFESKNFKGQTYDANGFIKYSFISDTITYYKKDNIVDVTKPVIFYYEYTDKDKYRTYQMQADFGSIKFNNFASLEGNIKVFPNFKDSFLSLIKTDKLHYDLNKGIISSKDYIEIIGPNFKNTGSNFKIDLNTKVFKIFEAPHATYNNVN